MASAERRDASRPIADVCLVLEGTYPYVRGGVSTWVHDLIGNLPDLTFALVHVGPEPRAYRRPRYTLPPNVVSLSNLYCREPLVPGGDAIAQERAARAERNRHARAPRTARMIRGIRRLHLDDDVDPAMLEDLGSRDLPIGALLHGRSSFDLVVELCDRLAPGVSFLDFFWHFRSMHAPLVRLLAAEPPAARVYHALCTGYAGLLSAVWSQRTGRPFLLTEHGIYSRERVIELDRWFRGRHDRRREARFERPTDDATASSLRKMWTHFFRALARCAYSRASAVVSLCEASRVRQIADGARTDRTLVVPNGIDIDGFQSRVRRSRSVARERGRLRVGFVGRLVPIKDVITFIRACQLALRRVELDVRIVGSNAEDPAYARRCRRLVARLGLEREIHFDGALPAEEIYPELDVLVLTSFSEGQPLVILEAGAVGIPVIASDVGACRELLEGRDSADRELGPGGIVTRLAAPEETAAAIVRLARNPELRRRMGDAARRRVASLYRESATVSSYRKLYTDGPWLASAGASSA